jgi:hypothetical protein
MKEGALMVGISVPKANFGVQILSENKIRVPSTKISKNDG